MITKTLEQSLEELRYALALDKDGRAVDTALAGVTQYNDPQSVPMLLDLLDDAAKYDEGMFSLVHAAEAFDDETYVRQLMLALPTLQARAPKWASIVLMRAMNNQETKEVLVKNLANSSPEVKRSVEWLCEKINERSPSFLSKTVPVLLAAQIKTPFGI